MVKGTPPPLFADMLLHCTISFYSEIQNPSLTHNVHYGSDKIDERKENAKCKTADEKQPFLGSVTFICFVQNRLVDCAFGSPAITLLEPIFFC